jgi:hypothetical protein
MDFRGKILELYWIYLIKEMYKWWAFANTVTLGYNFVIGHGLILLNRNEPIINNRLST